MRTYLSAVVDSCGNHPTSVCSAAIMWNSRFSEKRRGRWIDREARELS